LTIDQQARLCSVTRDYALRGLCISRHSGRVSMSRDSHREHRIRSATSGTGRSSGRWSALRSAWWPQALHHAKTDLTPCERMVASVIGAISLPCSS